MGNAPSSEDQDNNSNSPNQNIDETKKDDKDEEGKDGTLQDRGKAVSFSIPAAKGHDNDDGDENNDDDGDDSQEVSSSPSRGLKPSAKSSYFDMVSGTRKEARDEGTLGDLQWRNSNRSIRVISGDQVVGPSPHFWTRAWRRFRIYGGGSGTGGDAAAATSSSPSGGGAAGNESAIASNMKHYRIQSRKALSQDASSLYLDTTRAASILSEYLRWTFSGSFIHVLAATCIQFLVLVIVFAVFIRLVDEEQPQCITGAATNARDHILFLDAFQLSWTTLSTVGYGLIYPSLAKVDADHTRCLGINVLMAVEAFLGVLFGGVTGAIIFGKIARVQSIASVSFSHPLVIRYGLGVMGVGDHDTEEYVLRHGMSIKGIGKDDDNNQDDTQDKELPTSGNEKVTKEVEWPCPVLEFRIVNDMSEYVGGEIRDASINVAACFVERLDEPEDYLTLRGSILDHKKKKKKSGTPRRENVVKQTGRALLGGSRDAAVATGNMIQKLHHTLTKPLHLHSHSGNGKDGQDSKPFNAAQVENAVKEQLARQLLEDAAYIPPQMVTVDEGDHVLAPPRIYTKLEMAADTHPFFKRVWSVRHVLNEHSPLLSTTARNMIAQNGGKWPAELNNHASIRKHVHFEELVLSLSGTSNISGNSVYAQKVYSYESLIVGYDFAPILATDNYGKMVVDHRLISDVREQKGGGGEPIENWQETASHSLEVVKNIDLDISALNSNEFWQD